MSGLPVNTKSQAQEYRKQYMAYLALEAQNDAYNLMANQVYKQTGQPSRPPDTRTTTEKLADLEQLRVNVLNQLMDITDGQMALDTVTNLTNDELIFTSQMIDTIISDLKPKFSRGVPSQALLSYIRALRQKELATNGVSFTAQESTAQAILNAIQAGRVAGAPIPPFAPPAPPTAPPAPPTAPPAPPIAPPTLPSDRSISFLDELRTRQTTMPQQPPSMVPPSLQTPSQRPLNPFEQAILDRARQMGIVPEEIEQKSIETETAAFRQQRPEQTPRIKQTFSSLAEFYSLSWEKIRKWYDDWAEELPEVASLVPVSLIITRGADAGRLKSSFTYSKQQAKQQLTEAAQLFLDIVSKRKEPASPATLTSMETMTGLGMRRRALAPASRYPSGREILGYGIKTQKNINIDMSQGIKHVAPTYVPFGRFIINPSKLSRGFIEVRTLNGGKMNKYPDKQLSPSLTKIMKRMLDDRMPDEYDFNEMDFEDQEFLYSLAKDAKINERLNIPTPKLSKEDEEMNRFEILKGEIIAGNDSKELVKEFKQMLLKFSNDGRIKKNEAREILMDLTALGY